jgi:hypothetical protein
MRTALPPYVVVDAAGGPCWMRGGIVVTVEADQVRVESRLLAGQVGCPACPVALRPWGWARPREVHGIAGVLRPRRARCPMPSLPRNPAQVLDEFPLHPAFGARVDLVHQAEQQVDQGVGDLGRPGPAQRPQQRQPHRPLRRGQVGWVRPRVTRTS